MNFQQLLPEKYPGYIERFTKSEYPGCFDNYCRDVKCVFEQLDNGAADGAKCAEDFIGYISALLPRRFRRGLVTYDICRFLFLYTIPAALQHGTAAAQSFAESLLEQWNRSFPKYPLNKADFSKIFSGFRTRIMGFDMGRD